jgi:C_GCAxxG_C_C family probable redox protein
MIAGFGGGMGGLRGTCGAVSGMVFIAGMVAGGYEPADVSAKRRLYDMVKYLVSEFTKQFGTDCCRELLLRASCEPAPDPSVRTAAYYAQRPCARFVGAAARLLEEQLASIRQELSKASEIIS